MASEGWRRTLIAPLRLAIALLCGATVLALGARWSWFCDLFTHFRPQLALGLTLTALAALLLRQGRLSLVAAAGLLVNLLCMAPVVWPRAPVTVPDGRVVTAVSFNIAFFNANVPGVAPYLESLRADVVALQEVPGHAMPELLASLPSYPYHFVKANTGSYGVIVVSRWPLEQARVVDLGIRDRDAAQVVVQFPDTRLTVTATHLSWPMTGESARQRGIQMTALAKTLAECRGACIALGDFNVTRWSPHFQQLLRDSGQRDCARGVLVPQTWPSWRLPLRLRIDQCLANANVEVLRLGAERAAGSDHLATINELRIARTPRE